MASLLGNVVESFVSRWTVDVQDGGLDKLDKGLKSAMQGALGLSIQIGSLTYGLNKFIETAGSLEQIRIALQTLAGSAEKGNTLYTELEQLARRTPLNFMDIAEQAKAFAAKGFGINEITESVEMLGNVAAGVGIEALPRIALAFTQVRGKGQLMAQEMNQLGDAGVPILQVLGEQFDKTEGEVRAMVEAGEVGFPVVQEAFESMTGPGGKFENLLEKQADTMKGLKNLIAGEFLITLGKLGEGRAGKEVKKLLQDLLTWLKANGDMLVEVGGVILRDAITWLRAFAKILYLPIRALSLFTSQGEAAIYILRGLMAAFMTFMAIKVVMGLMLALKSLIVTIGPILLSVLLSPWFWIAVAILGVLFLIEDLVAYFQKGRDSLIAWGELWKTIKEHFHDFMMGFPRLYLALRIIFTSLSWFFTELLPQAFEFLFEQVEKLAELLGKLLPTFDGEGWGGNEPVASNFPFVGAEAANIKSATEVNHNVKIEGSVEGLSEERMDEIVMGIKSSLSEGIAQTRYSVPPTARRQ